MTNWTGVRTPQGVFVLVGVVLLGLVLAGCCCRRSREAAACPRPDSTRELDGDRAAFFEWFQDTIAAPEELHRRWLKAKSEAEQAE